jgi:hypothetical protein
MKSPQPNLSDDALTARVLKALRLAAKDAQRIAQQQGTPIYVSVNGKVKGVKPWLKRSTKRNGRA